MRNFIFDLDGTIINSSQEVLKCFRQAFDEAGFPIDETRLTSNIIGPPLKEIIQNIAPDIDEKNLETVMANFRRIYDYDENDISTFYQGIVELLAELKSYGRVFMATFKPTKPTMRIVEQFKLNMFDDIYTIDKFTTPITKAQMILDIVEKYHLEKSETVMIGDAASDVKAAKDAGVVGIGVLWGYGDDKTQLIQNSTCTVNSVEELKKCLKLNCQTMSQNV